ncbi:Protein CSN12 [Neolecta irregularis DAH-3]|uniref:Protein CSN12 n=1 Tax=Neolecta irregularis (strain DAH-3) TaxID=1198029 RepID=A0A1U7LWX2_NEOID|nr:Protein CSN12 [Neolecta irregularis DAH-3]|eukprot:OLL27119.1 Protein CSN12 [Neolecta irregularis DAH-3]
MALEYIRTLHQLLSHINKCILTKDGEGLSRAFHLGAPQFSAPIAYSASEASGEREIRSDLNDKSWTDPVLTLWKAIGALGREENYIKVLDELSILLQQVLRGFMVWDAWALHVLYVVCKDLRRFALIVDRQLQKSGKKAERLEEAARAINKAFTLCITDRAPMEESRKWGSLCIAGILFKIYFKLNRLPLCKNLQRSMTVSDIPPLEYFPKAHVVTYRYYTGVLYFLNEEYRKSEEELMAALYQCHPESLRNQELILTYLIPTLLVTSHSRPKPALLSRFPNLERLYSPIATALRSGNLREYDLALVAGETEFITRRTYLTVERARVLAVRNLFRRTWLLSDTNTRLSIETFRVALQVSGISVDLEEVECMLANMIYKGYVKGYISQERSMVVLSAKEAFPSVVPGFP